MYTEQLISYGVIVVCQLALAAVSLSSARHTERLERLLAEKRVELAEKEAELAELRDRSCGA